ncbi:MAG: hypothetical protein HY897_24625 [Deltaproteobacteria bacterium]|nr:hypothetical protein [Deltaproteobacteria bacterium]
MTRWVAAVACMLALYACYDTGDNGALSDKGVVAPDTGGSGDGGGGQNDTGQAHQDTGAPDDAQAPDDAGGTPEAGAPDSGDVADSGTDDGGAVAADVGTDAGTQQPVDLKINFGPPGFSPPAGWQHDDGSTFDNGRGRGWSRDLTSATRKRNVTGDPILDTVMFPGGIGVVDMWEIVVPNGDYKVSLASGDEFEQGPNRIEIEGVVAVDSVMSAAGQFIRVNDLPVTVTDGRLTLRAGDGTEDTALNFITITSGTVQCTPEPEVCDGKDNDCNNQIDEGGVCQPDQVCYSSSLSSQQEVEAAGFRFKGGSFRDGGYAVDGTGDRIERTLSGVFDKGAMEFEAKDLLRIIPFESGTHGCERFVFNLNIHEGENPQKARMVLANMASDCGQPRGNLRVILAGAFCCMDTKRLPDQSDGQWHKLKVTWDGAEVRLLVDGVEWGSEGYGGITLGTDPYLWFGSESAGGDETGAVFRNLKACNYVF